MTKKVDLFLIDASSFLYRAYHALRPLQTPDGIPVQAVYGFCRMLLKLIKRFKPDELIIVWDSPGKTIRHKLYKPYKETRQAPPSDLFEQKKLILEFVDIAGLAQLAEPGIEADDLIASVAQFGKKTNRRTIIVSSDKDLAQLVNESVVLFDPFKDNFVDQHTLEQKYGFPLERLSLYYALVGDASDNIPGVKGIGAKTAQKLAAQFSSLQDLYDNLDKIESNRTRTLLVEGQDLAFLSEELFKLRPEEYFFKHKDATIPEDLLEQVRPFFEQLHFSSFLKEIPAPKAAQLTETFAKEYGYTFETVSTIEELGKLCKTIERKKHFALDTETDGKPPLLASLIGLSICCSEGSSFYIPVNHKTDGPQLAQGIALSHLSPLLENKDITKVMHNAKFDLHIMENVGVRVEGLVFDTMVAAGLLRSEEADRIGLKFLSEKFLKQVMPNYKDVISAQNAKNFAYVPLAPATDYAAADAHQTLSLEKIIRKELEREDVLKVYEHIEHPLIPILTAMEQEGIGIDVTVLDKLEHKVDRELEHITKKIEDTAQLKEGEDINLNSPAQVAGLLFEKLGLTPVRKTTGKTGYSTSAEVLAELAKQHPVPKLIVHYRELFKLKSTYLEALRSEINPNTGRIHTTFKQTTVATGRLASANPNMQNIPADNSSYPIREAFIPPEGHLFISADYSQIELRVLAYLSQDENLKKAFERGEDIHARTAAGLFDVPLKDVTSTQRQLAKRINFSILYGLTPYGLSKDLDISMSDAKTYIDRYMDHYPGVSAWMDEVVEETKKHGYVTTLWGRKRAIPGIYEKNKNLYNLARRVAINTKAQGTSADLMKLGMIALHKKLERKFPEAKMVLQIHDELLITAPKNEAQKVAELSKEVLEEIVKWNVPLVIQIRLGTNWHEASK
ncbi:MAG: DNA polymerase I [Candidatus Babeliaceae bacterium]|nr:DNA polymerase I [Candidatus Babeliaceae bacterium]